MCGICGVFHFDSSVRAQQDAVARMANRLRHRGPDDEGTFAGGPVALGHTRLAILDTSAAGHQPMLSEDGRVAILLNGEIYNFRAVREELAALGARFATRTDTEVVLAAYLAYGEDFLSRLEGMFALAIWDARADRLLLARDPAGIKPLYYAVSEGALWFASELGALLESGAVERALDASAVAHYFARQYVGGEQSIIRGVSRLAPATRLVATKSGIRLSGYEARAGAAAAMHAGGVRGGHGGGGDGAARVLLELLSAAVASHLQSDVPVGVFLSGGIDSSLIAALLARHGAAGIPAFTVAVADDRVDVDETAAAARVARAFQLPHHVVRFGPEEALAELPGLAARLDEPLADYALLPTFLLAKEARRHVTVALSGEGADEVFGGYPRYLHFMRCARRARLPLVGAALGAPCRDYSATRVFDRRALTRLLAPLRERGPVEPPARVSIANGTGGDDLVNRMLAIDFAGWLPDDLLTKVDRATMLASLEARVPYLDRAVVAWVAALPGERKIRGTVLKSLLREAAAGLLPAETIERPKHGFTVPVARWLRGPLRSLLGDTLGSARCRERGVADAREVTRLLAELDRKGDHGLRLWSLLVFELWCQATLDA